MKISITLMVSIITKLIHCHYVIKARIVKNLVFVVVGVDFVVVNCGLVVVGCVVIVVVGVVVVVVW